jgi:hypothetical protein
MSVTTTVVALSGIVSLLSLELKELLTEDFVYALYSQ